MCMRNTSEGCILSEQQSALKKEVLSLDERMDKLEKDFATMRSETLDGFRQGAEVMREIGASVSNLSPMTSCNASTTSKPLWLRIRCKGETQKCTSSG